MKFHTIITLFLMAATSLNASEVDTTETLSKHVQNADEVFRVVVLSHHMLEGGQPFEKIAKCRVVDRYSSCAGMNDFVYIPYKKPKHRWQNDLKIGSDCIVFTGKMDSSKLMHLISDYSVHSIEQQGVRFFFKDYPVSQGLKNFKKELLNRWTKKQTKMPSIKQEVQH